MFPEYAPWERDPDMVINAMEECKVTGILYKVDNPAYCTLELRLLKNPEDSDEAVITVNYHVGADIPEFIVLTSKVKWALALDLKAGQRYKL